MLGEIEEYEGVKLECVYEFSGNFISAGGNRSAGNRNAYKIYKNLENGKNIVKMTVKSKGQDFYTFFDSEDIPIITLYGTWYIMETGYVACNTPSFHYLHQVIMDNQEINKQNIDDTVDHINRNKLDNRRENLEYKSKQGQALNSKGSIYGTKRERKINAQSLPDGISQDMLPKYVEYRSEPKDKPNKEYFVLTKHPAIDSKIILNGTLLCQQYKSSQGLWNDPKSKDRIRACPFDKLGEIRKIYDELDSILKESIEKNTLNIEREETDIIKILKGERTNKCGMNIYKYSLDNILVNTYASQVEASKDNGCKEITIRRAIDDGKPRNGFYYRKIKI